jgi:hypothetical protein
LKKPEFAYKPNELAARFVEEGGEAVLMTAALLNRIAASAFIKFGGDILHPGETKDLSLKLTCFGLQERFSYLQNVNPITRLNQRRL